MIIDFGASNSRRTSLQPVEGSPNGDVLTLNKVNQINQYTLSKFSVIAYLFLCLILQFSWQYFEARGQESE